MPLLDTHIYKTSLQNFDQLHWYQQLKLQRPRKTKNWPQLTCKKCSYDCAQLN